MKYLFLIFFLLLCSCSDEYYGCAGRKARKITAVKSSSEESDHSDYGGCEPPPPPDNIKLSSKELWFNAEGGIDSITTEGENWYILDAVIIIEDTVIFLRPNQYYVRGDGLEELHPYESSIPYLVDEENEYGIVNIKDSWFTVDKLDKKKIVFSVNQNETRKQREISVFLMDINSYNVYINVTQSAD